MPTQKRAVQKQKNHTCIACKGTGELSEKEFGYFGYMLDLATAMLKLKGKEADLHAKLEAAHKAYLTALVEPEEALKNISA